MSTTYRNTPQARYQAAIEQGQLTPDSAQQAAIEQLQRLYDRLLQREGERRGRGMLSRLKRKLGLAKTEEPEEGVYLWGGVGRGKTHIMDIFYDSLPLDRKMRTHFHRFMRRVHAELRQLNDQSDPLELVADRLSGEANVICFDEFFVIDITDAMILGNLFQALFARGVTLVATSNIPPEQLYKDGLQRDRFVPAIKLLQKYTRVINVDGGVDYRLRALERAPLYYSPTGPDAERALQDHFYALVPDRANVKSDVALNIEGRHLQAKCEGDDVVWFEFLALCAGPRSQNDYIELAREYHAVIVSNVPTLGGRNDDEARRFIYLVDEFYDRGVKLILSAAKPIEELYQGGRLAFEFERTQSRLLEMQSQEYLGREHKA